MCCITLVRCVLVLRCGSAGWCGIQMQAEACISIIKTGCQAVRFGGRKHIASNFQETGGAVCMVTATRTSEHVYFILIPFHEI
jgi:hypothetical protein